MNEKKMQEAQGMGILPGDLIEVELSDGTHMEGNFNIHPLADFCILDFNGFPITYKKILRKVSFMNTVDTSAEGCKECGGGNIFESSMCTHCHTNAVGSKTKELWKDPVYRAKMIEAHKTRLVKHGFASSSAGDQQKQFYKVWGNIRTRCHKVTGSKNYTGRGIKNSWESFEPFYEDMYESYLEHRILHGDDTSIERIDNDGNYCKENCRWATREEQSLNKTVTAMVPLKVLEKALGVYSITFRRWMEEQSFEFAMGKALERIVKERDASLVSEIEGMKFKQDALKAFPHNSEYNYTNKALDSILQIINNR